MQVSSVSSLYKPNNLRGRKAGKHKHIYNFPTKSTHKPLEKLIYILNAYGSPYFI